MIGLLGAAALLLAAAGLTKLGRAGSRRSAFQTAALPGARALPAALANRLAGLAELLVAAAVLLVGGRPGALLLVLGYAVLAGLSVRMVAVAAGQDCGCFGRPSPISHWHTGVNLTGTLIGLAGLVWPAGSLVGEFGRHPVLGAALALAAVLLAYLGYLTMTALPDLRAAAAELELAG